MAELGICCGKGCASLPVPLGWGTSQQIISRANAGATEVNLTRQHQEGEKKKKIVQNLLKIPTDNI